MNPTPAATGKYGDIHEDSANRATAWCQYLESHARRCYALVADKGFRAAQTLANKIKQGKLNDGFTMRDIYRQQWRNLSSNESVNPAIDWLESEGWIKPYRQNDIGRPTTKYLINPKVKKND